MTVEQTITSGAGADESSWMCTATDAIAESERRCDACLHAEVDGLMADMAKQRAAIRIDAPSLVRNVALIDRLIEQRRPVVIHVILPTARAHALIDATAAWGLIVLHARHAQDAADLTLIAHRAAEDAEVPVIVLHDGPPASETIDRVRFADRATTTAVLASPTNERAPHNDAAPAHRRAAERAPFALASALRAFEKATGRPLRAIDLHGATSPDIVLVASGSLSSTARAAIEEAAVHRPGLKVAALQVIALRPFPGAQVVRAIHRASTVAVVERIDDTLSLGGPLARTVKAAFADALTWSPGYPGIGRIPMILAGSIEPRAGEPSTDELVAILDDASTGDHAHRSFLVSPSAPIERALAVHVAHDANALQARGAFRVRRVGDGRLVAQLLADLFTAHVRAITYGADPKSCDVVVSPSPIHSFHAGGAIDLVAVDADAVGSDESGAKTSQNPSQKLMAGLREGGVVVLASSRAADEMIASLPADLLATLATRGATAWVVTVPLQGADRIDVALVVGALCARAEMELPATRLAADAERSLSRVRPPLADDRKHALHAAISHALAHAVKVPIASRRHA